MFRNCYNYYGLRNFSQSRIFRNLEKIKPNEPEKSYPSGVANLKMDHSPSAFEKKVLVWSGKFKKNEVPDRVSYGTIENAKSRFRIRVSTLLVIGSFMLCGFYVWLGKKRAREGQSIAKTHYEKDREILARVHK